MTTCFASTKLHLQRVDPSLLHLCACVPSVDAGISASDSLSAYGDGLGPAGSAVLDGGVVAVCSAAGQLGVMNGWPVLCVMTGQSQCNHACVAEGLAQIAAGLALLRQPPSSGSAPRHRCQCNLPMVDLAHLIYELRACGCTVLVFMPSSYISFPMCLMNYVQVAE